jgi:hypothetical protein
MSLSHKLGLVVLLTLPIAACGEPSGPLHDQPAFAPAGNDNKLVTPIHIEVTEECSGGIPVDLVIDGWIQSRVFPQENNRNVQLTVYHNIWTFTNRSTGETYLFPEAGPDRVYIEGGKLFVAIVGRAPFGHIGRLVFDLSTGTQVFSAGRDFGDLLLLACEKIA